VDHSPSPEPDGPRPVGERPAGRVRIRNYYSRSLQALGVEVQVPPGISEELRAALLSH